LGLEQRRIRVRVEIPERSPGDGVVTWRNGSTARTPVGSATEAYDRLLAGAMRCANCPADGTMDGITPQAVTLTAVRLTTLVVQTTRGQATVPAWQFSFAESRVRLLVAAAKAARVEPAPPGRAAGMPVLDASIAPRRQDPHRPLRRSPSFVADSLWRGLLRLSRRVGQRSRRPDHR
jgi:hypothetical protein